MSDSSAKRHDYHLVSPSPWPILGAVAALVMALGAVALMRWRLDEPFTLFGNDAASPWPFLIGTLGVVYVMFMWWRDVIDEAHKGDHTPVVQLHLRYGMTLFIVSEIMFFGAWFWSYFDVALTVADPIQEARRIHTGEQWPPADVKTFNPLELPLLNTVILLASGTTVTWAHHALIADDRKGLVQGLLCTVALGILFTAVQAYEYSHAAFGFSQSIYGATFYMATGFHGFHVIVGTIFLAVCLVRALKGHFSPKQHFGFEAAAWYWHFVDAVWLFLFAAIYVWGAGSGGVG